MLHVCCCLTVLAMLLPLSAAASDTVRLQLKWHHQFQFAGYYAAREKGYYREAGLDVEFIPARPGEDPVEQVVQGTAEFGVGTTDLLLLREKGIPVVVLATIFQHSPLALMTLKGNGLQTVHDLVGQKVMIEPGAAELYAYLRSEGVPADRLTLLPHSFNVQDLISGNVDAMSVYVISEPFDLEEAGKEYSLYSPRSGGIDFYGDNLFTTEKLIKRNPEMVRAFREASLKGWEYAMQHPEEMVQLIHKRYSTGHSLEHLRFEARQMVPLLQASLVEIGHMNPGRWRHIAEVYADLGMLKPGFDFKGFLYDPSPPQPLIKQLIGRIAVGLVLALIPAGVAIRFARLSATLKRAVAESERINAALRESEALHRSILHASPNGITVTDLEGRIRKASPAALAIFGIEQEEDVVGRPINEFIVPEEHERVKTNIGLMFQGALPGPNEYRAIRADGSVFEFEVNGEFIRGPNGEPTSMVFIGRDVTERKRAKEALEESNRQLASLSITDALTGLANRRRFDDALEREHARHARSGAELSLIMLDIDHFKAFNDRYGHVSGDDCLRRIARVIADCAARAPDLPARYGGEEFACILPETDRAGAIAIAEKIRHGIMAIAIPHDTSDIAGCVTASLGVAAITCHPDKPPSEIVLLADQMLYKAKTGGRNRVESCSRIDRPRSSPAPENALVHLVWKDVFCCGNPLIDSQHRELFSASNELLEAILSARPHADIATMVERLLDDIGGHFRDEETLLEAMEFPGLKQHVEEHARLYDEGRKLAESFHGEPHSLPVGAVFTFLVYEVVLQHMLGTDREFFQFLAEHDPARPEVPGTESR